MLDWLRKSPSEAPTISVGTRELAIVIRRLAQARQMTLRLAPDGAEVRISVPRWARTADAMAFAKSRVPWLQAQLAKIPPAIELGAGSEIAVGDQQFILDHQPRAIRRPVQCGNRLIVGGPAEGLPRRLQRWLEAKAIETLADDLEEYCARANVPVPKLALSRAQRRWGSCAKDGTIRINWRLIMAPSQVRRAVVAHEVAHLVHFDHSPKFHALLGGLFEGDLDAANHWLRRHGRELYAPFARD